LFGSVCVSDSTGVGCFGTVGLLWYGLVVSLLDFWLCDLPNATSIWGFLFFLFVSAHLLFCNYIVGGERGIMLMNKIGTSV
jgi:prepilin signal peptidase PulO-like enzyme (type II secretory pathway)